MASWVRCVGWGAGRLIWCVVVFAGLSVVVEAQPGVWAAGSGPTVEVITDSVGQMIRLNGQEVGRTPAVLSVTPMRSARIEVGSGRSPRLVIFDVPSTGRIRLDMKVVRDTLPVPVLRTEEALVGVIEASGRFPPLPPPVRPVAPRPPDGRTSSRWGIAATGLGSLVCLARDDRRCPAVSYVSAVGLGLAAKWLVQRRQQWEFERAQRAHQRSDSRWQEAELERRERLAQRAEALRDAVATLRREDRARQLAVIEQNERIRRTNRELPIISFIGAPETPVAGARTQLLPPVLRILSLTLHDTDGDSILSAGEQAQLAVRVANEGRGEARGVTAVSAGADGIHVARATLGALGVGEIREAWLELRAGDVADGTASIRVEAQEGNGFDADPFALTFPTRAYRPPKLIIADVGVEDAQGRAIIAPGSSVEVTVRVQNRGGPASNVRVVFDRGDSTVLFTNESGRSTVEREIGRLREGEYRDVSIEVVANRRATRFPLRVSISEATGRFGLPPQELGLPLFATQRPVTQRTLTGVGGGVANGPVLGSALLEGIPEARAPNPNAFAVIIGNRNYRTAPPVTYAANDAAVVRQYAERTLGVLPGNIFELPDATKSTLEDVFGVAGNPNGQLKDLVIPGRSEVFIFFSGHGAPDPETQRAYLVPVDANANRLGITGYSLDLLYENLAALQAKHVTVVIDACFSGGTAGGEMLITAASPIGIRVNDPSRRFAAGGATVIAAASGQQLANWFPEQRHGLLTYLFLKGLRGEADQDRDGSVTVGEMRAWLTHPATGLPYEARRLHGREQTPQVWGSEGRRLR